MSEGMGEGKRGKKGTNGRVRNVLFSPSTHSRSFHSRFDYLQHFSDMRQGRLDGVGFMFFVIDTHLIFFLSLSFFSFPPFNTSFENFTFNAQRQFSFRVTFLVIIIERHRLFLPHCIVGPFYYHY